MSDDSPPESHPSPATEDGDRDPAAEGGGRDPATEGGGRDPAAAQSLAGDGDGHTAAGTGIREDSSGVVDGEAAERDVVNSDGRVEGASETGGSDDDDVGKTGEGSVAWLYLAGLLIFLASMGAFLWDLATGHAIERSLVTNAIGAIVLVAWAGVDSYRDPDSGVATRGGAVGTGLILVGIYLFTAGLVIAVTSPLHGRMLLGLAMVAGSVPLVLVGFLTYPTDDVLADGEGATKESAHGAAANGADGDT